MNAKRVLNIVQGMMRTSLSLSMTILMFVASQSLLAQPAFKWVAGGQSGTLNEYVQSVDLDGSGNVYVAGSFEGTVDFDYSSGVFNLTSAGGYDAFIAKYSSSGALAWAKRLGGSVGDEEIYALAVNTSGDVFVTGYFEGTVDFDPDAAIVNVTSNGGFDAFFGRYTTAGAYVWVNKVGSSVGDDYGTIITVDGLSNVYVGGIFTFTADFDPSGATVNRVSAGLEDGFFGRYTSAGAYVWAYGMGSTENDGCRDLALIGTHVWYSGYYGATMNGNPAGTASNAANLGGLDGFFGQYNQSDALQGAWGTIRSTGDDVITSISLSGSNLYTSGYFSGTASMFGNGSTGLSRTSAGGTDIFVARHDATTLNLTWLDAMGGTGDDGVNLMALDASGNIYTTGYFGGTFDFDPSASIYNVASVGGLDIFLARFSPTAGGLSFVNTNGGVGDDQGTSIALDASSNIYLAQIFESTGNFINLDFRAGSYQITPAGGIDWIVARYDQTSFGADPTAQPTAFSTSLVTPTSATVSWTAAAGAPAGYIVTRSVGSPPVNTPIDGLTFSASQTWKDFTVAYVGSSTSFPETGLTPSTNYQYKIYSYNSSGTTINYLTSAPLTGSFTTTGSGPPTISSFSPTSGPVGSSISISGSNFSTTVANNVVYFGATKATVTNATATQLTVTVPGGSTFMPISVTNSAGLTAYSTRPFIVTIAGAASLSATSFAAKQDIGAGNFPDGIVTGDFDLDNKPDVAVAVGNNNTIGTWKNTSSTGTIAFGSPSFLTAGTSPINPVIVDWDGDGKLDIVAPNPTSTSVSIYRNTTSGAITFAGKVDISALPSPRVAAVGDMDGDGKPDLAISNQLNTSVSIYRNTSTVGAVSASFVTNLTTNATPYGVVLADINGDALVDLIVANGGTNNVSVFRNTSTSGAISFFAKVDFPTANIPQMLAIADYDQDGKLDIAATCSGTVVVSILRNTTTVATTPTFATKVDLSANSNVVGIVADDLDGDGKVDIVSGNVNANNISVFKNNSTSGTISFGTKLDFATGLQPHYVMSITDIDGDGKKDILTTNSADNTFSVFRNVISVTVAEPTAQPTSFIASNQTATTADVAFTAAAGTPSGYIAIRATGAAPTNDPVDNTTYSVGTVLGASDRVVAIGPSTSFSETGLTASTTYHYKLYSYNSSGGVVNYRTVSPLQGTVTTISALASEPTAQPTNFGTANQSSSSLLVTYTWAAGTPAGYLIVRGPAGGAAPTGTPVDGTEYSIGATLGNGTVIYSGGEAAYTDVNLAASTTYSYRIFSFNGSGTLTNYLITNPLAGTGLTNNVARTVPSDFGTVTTSTTLDIYAIRYVVHATTAFAGGDNGLMLKTTNGGTSWSTVTVPTTDAIWGIHFSSMANGLAVGSNGLVMRTTDIGSTWSLVTSPATDALYAVYIVPGTQVGYAAGDNGFVMKTMDGGATWTELPGAAAFTPSGSYHNTIYFKSATEGLIGGPDGVIRTTDGGTTWTSFSDDPVLWYTFPTPSIGYAVGSGGLIMKTTDGGTNWTAQDSGVTTTLWSAHFVDASIGFAVGSEGIVLKTTNGGTTWNKALEAATGVVYSVHFGITSIGEIAGGIAVGEGGYIAKAETAPGPLAPTLSPTNPTTIDYGSTANVTVSIAPGFVSRVASAKFKSIGIVNDAKAMAPTTVTPTVSNGVYTGTITSTTDTNGDKVGFKYWFVFEYDAQFGRKDSTAYTHVYVKYPSTNTLKLTGLKAGSTQNDYQLISIPITPDAAGVTSIFGPVNKQEWRLWGSSPTSNGTTYTEVTGNVALGKGYWYITTSTLPVDLGPGTAYNAKANDPFKLVLSAGYNLIGNPYNFNVGWSSGASVKDLRTFANGAWSSSTTLEPFKGYFVDVDVAGSYNVPLTGNFNGGRTRELRIEQNESSWELDLVVTQGSLRNEMGRIGMHPDALIGYDILDERVFPMPEFFDLASVTIDRPEAGIALEQDYVPTTTNAVWDFTLKERGESSPVTLSWKPELIASIGRDLYLFDEEAISLIDMRTVGIHATRTNAPLKIITGDPLFVKGQVRFGESRVGTLYPNPATQGFNVPVAMTKAGVVQIRIFDMKGVELASQAHFAGEGLQNITVNGLPEGLNGLYLVTTEAEGVGRRVQKLIFK